MRVPPIERSRFQMATQCFQSDDFHRVVKIMKINFRTIFSQEDVRLVECMYLVLTRMPGGVTVGDSGLCYCVPCPSSAFNSLCL